MRVVGGRFLALLGADCGFATSGGAEPELGPENFSSGAGELASFCEKNFLREIPANVWLDSSSKTMVFERKP